MRCKSKKSAFVTVFSALNRSSKTFTSSVAESGVEAFAVSARRRHMFSAFGIVCALCIVSTVIGMSFYGLGTEVLAAERDELSDAVALYVGSSVAYVNNSETLIDAEAPELAPVIVSGKTYVPVRFISENLKASVNWNAADKTVTISYRNKLIVMTQDKDGMTVNGQAVSLDAPARNIDGRIFVPLRSLSEVMGKEVFYDRGLIIISDTKDIFDKKKDKARLDTIIARVNNLPRIGNLDNMNRLISAFKNTMSDIVLYDMKISDQFDSSNEVMMERADTAAGAVAKQPLATNTPQSAAAESTAANDKAAPGYSTTNTQVQGVDEGDIIKTDGEYLYYTTNSEIAVVKAVPANDMRLTSRIKFAEAGFAPEEMYVDGNMLIVLGRSYSYQTDYSERPGFFLPTDGNMTKVYIYDTSDKENIKIIRELETRGNLVASRKIGGSLYFASGYYTYYLYQMDNESDPVLPYYKDTNKSKESVTLGLKDIYYFPNPRECVFTTIMGVDLTKPEKDAQVYAYFGGGEKLYVSTDNMYVASTTSNFTKTRGGSDTTVYKFSLNNGGITYLCKTSVPGRVLNQFSMDESEDYFRIATTEYNDKWEMSNSMYVLDEMLNITGKLTDIAPTEQIYSVRFMGDRAYMVTFRLTDPLFTIDLKDPKKPKILGALKIPGYSDYLHPYDDNHLIGFGKDTVERYGSAFYQGMKISMFDVTDVSDPKEMFTEVIGTRGTESPLLHNHRALLFSKEKNLLAFPVMVMDSDSKSGDELEYGAFDFQGAYVYGIDMNDGFQLRGRITHMSDEDYTKAGLYSGDMEKYIERIIFIGDNLYSASQNKITANAISDLKEKGSAKIKD